MAIKRQMEDLSEFKAEPVCIVSSGTARLGKLGKIGKLIGGGDE